MDAPKDDLKWFGEGFDGFPKRLAEDSVEYTLFIVNPKLSHKEVLSRLESVRKEATKLTSSLLKDFIWQRDAFGLKLVQTPDLIYLHGLTNYGDSVEDEWLIVYLLRELSKRFIDLWIKVIDTDGEFLLIEAANALPRWLNPEIADNRVWISDSQLKIIPPAASPTILGNSRPPPNSLKQVEALNIIKNTPDKIEHFPQMEKEAFYRLTNYPAQIEASLHRSLVTIPRNLAFILHELPSVIAPAVEAFYLRDPIGLKPLHSSNTSALTFQPTDLVTISVKFTKVLFAQLKSQQFEAPPAWKSTLLAAEKDAKTKGEEGRKEVDRMEMGMKVTSGFEMLISDGIRKDNRAVREMNILLEDISTGEPLPTDAEIEQWEDGKKEDSEAWLDINFEDFEKELQGKKGASSSSSQTPPPLATQPSAASGGENGKPIFGPERPPADGKANGEEGTGFGDAKTQQDLKKMVERFESFLTDNDAGPDGAELDDDDYDNDEDEDEDEDEDDDDEDDSDGEQPMLDPKAFARMMREMMGVSTADLDDIPDFVPESEREKPLRDSSKAKGTGKGKKARFEEVEDSDDDSTGSEYEAAEFKKVMAAMDAELREAGALELDPKPKPDKPSALPNTSNTEDSQSKGKAEDRGDLLAKQSWESESEEEMDIDFNLAKNLLESFKSQAGMAGPGGNLMGIMGMKLPRDEGEEEEARREAGKSGPFYRGGPI